MKKNVSGNISTYSPNISTYSPLFRPSGRRTPMELFKSLPEGTRAQLIGNMLVMEPAPLVIHQDISATVGVGIFNHVKQQALGKVLFAPVDVYFDDHNVFQPDILYISRERLFIIDQRGLRGAPDMIVEILSPSTSTFDRQEKMQVYERTGVREYWLVEPNACQAQGYQLAGEGFQPLPPARGLIRSVLLEQEFPFGN